MSARSSSTDSCPERARVKKPSMRHPGFLVISALAMVLTTGCYFTKAGKKFNARESDKNRNAVTLTNLTAVPTTNQVQAEWLQPPSKPYRLGPGDKIEIEIVGDNASRAVTQIGPDGRLYYY